MADKHPVSQHAQGKFIAQAAHGGTAIIHNTIVLPAKVQEQNRVRILDKLRFLYEEQLEQSLQGMAFITLGLTEKPDAVFSHAKLLFLSSKKPERRLEPGTSILQVYDDSKQELLVLGEPGTGKSRLLLDLARQLLKRAEQDANHPLPVVLPLSSWREKQPLQDWIATQFSLMYDVSLEVSRGWVLNNQILPLLDGLDEVPQGGYMACMKAIMNYHKEHLVPLVVSSRRTEYEKIKPKQRLTLHNAVVVEPLSTEEIEAYFDRAGPPLAALQRVLRTNPVLQELMKTPLMLSIMTLTYMGSQAGNVPQQGPAEVQQQKILASYVQHMLQRRKSWREDQVIWWLCSLARMMRQGQSILLVERMQPEWLLPKELFLYRSGVGLIYGLSCACVGLLSFLPLAFVYRPFDLFASRTGALIFGLLGLTGLVVGFLLSIQRGIKPAEHIVWSWRKALLGFDFILNQVLDRPLLLFIAAPLAMYSFPRGLVSCIVLLLVIPELTGAFFQGLSKEQISEGLPLAPNGGIWRSLRHALIIGPIFGFITAPIAAAAFYYEMNLPLSFGTALTFLYPCSLFDSLIGMFIAGLEDFVKHFTLRFVLWRSGRLPHSLVPFLEDMAHCILLRKVGRGYTFPHRLLMEYFAELDVTPPAKFATSSSTLNND